MIKKADGAILMKIWYGILVFMATLFTACAAPTQAETEKEQLEFTVVSEERLPEELKEIVEEKKESAFKVTYED